MKILVTIPKGEIFDSFVPPLVQARLEEVGDVEYNETAAQFTQKVLAERLKGKDAVITGWGTAKIDKIIIEAAADLKIIAHTGGTVQMIADKAAYDAGIKILSGNDIYAESVAESVIAYALTALRKIPDYIDDMRRGGWENESIWEGLLEQKIGIVGYGMTARHLVKMLKVFRCETLVYSSHISEDELQEGNMKRATLEEIFSTCKIVSLHSALTPKNHHMINKNLLDMLQPDAILINTARGEIIDESAMIESLSKGRYRAVLDVFEQEPLPVDSPLRKLKNAYLIPHRAGPTYDRRKYVTLRLAADLENFFAGRPLNLEISKEYSGFMTQK